MAVGPVKAGLTPADFNQGDLTPKFIRESDPRVKDQLEGVIDAIVDSHNPGRLLRAFPGAYYSDMNLNLAVGLRIPGGVGTIMGDSHPKQFGFLLVPKEAEAKKKADSKPKLPEFETKFGPNDFDDCGQGPVALDAAHYFTLVQEMYGEKDSGLTDRLRKKYVDVVFNRSPVAKPPASMVPTALAWDAIKKDLLDKHTKDDDGKVHRQFRRENDLGPIEKDSIKKEVRAAVEAFIDGAEILDLAERAHDTGGSGGYDRYWVLINHDDEDGEKRKEIIELKEAGPPGVDKYGKTAQMTGNARMTALKTAFYGKNIKDDHVCVTIDGKKFELRRKSRMYAVDLDDKKLSDEQREAMLMAQVSFLANLHRAGWRKDHAVTANSLGKWLAGSEATLVQRWQTAFDKFEKKHK